MRKLAVIGAGNAGIISALHFYRHSPYLDVPIEIDLYHDSNHHPIEKVGQGTVTITTELISETLGLTWFDNKIGATLKTGILYKNWGRKKDQFFHDFYSMDNVAMHYTPKKLSDVVLSSGKFNVREQEINDPEKEVDADFIFDCRGRKAIDKETLGTIVNPINSVLLASLPKKEMVWTEAQATPNGWTFVVPTEDKLSLGYLYNANITSKEEATQDFQERFGVEEIEHSMRFENYCSFNPFVGERTLLNGNQCAFIEPLEATATGLYLYIAKIGFDRFINKLDIPQCLQLLHKEVSTIEKFILWHYKTGSKFNSPFWSHVEQLPFTPIKAPTGKDMYGQWHHKSFEIWEENTKEVSFSRTGQGKVKDSYN
tara:strand:- start:66 stop:1175 length:1110 start_codon:yes stop_codon:yes gene_type:complete